MRSETPSPLLRTPLPLVRIATLAAMSIALALPARALAQPIAIVGGRVHPVSGPVIDNGTVVIDGGRITAVGADVPLPVGARVVDAKGKWVTPGLVNALTSLGVSEVGAVASTDDSSAKGEAGIAAALRVWDGLNPASVLWTPARNEGVTSVVAVPTGGLVAGQAAFLDTLGDTRAALVRRAPAAMAVSLGAQTAEVDPTVAPNGAASAHPGRFDDDQRLRLAARLAD